MPPVTAFFAATSSVWIGVGVIFAVVVVGFVAIVAITKATKQRMRKVAAARGWNYAERDDTMLGRFATWPFAVGRDRHADNVITGVFEGHTITLFDFEFFTYEVGIPGGAQPYGSAPVAPPRSSGGGIFEGLDETLRVAPKEKLNPDAKPDADDLERWGICVMEMPRAVTPVVIRPVFSLDGRFESLGQQGRQDSAALPMGDGEFDKKFLVRAEDRNVAAALLPKPTMDLLVAHRDVLLRNSVYFWTWDRYLFSLDTSPLSEKSIDLRLSIMARMIEHAGR